MLQLFIAFYVGSIIVFWLGQISIVLTVSAILKRENVQRTPDLGGLLAAITISLVPFVNTFVGLGTLLFRANAIEKVIDDLCY